MKKYISFLAVAVFSFAVGAASADTPAVSFTPVSGNTFNNGIGFSLGFEFTATSNLTVDALGYFDDGSLQELHTVGIYNSSGTLLASATITGGTLMGFFDYVTIAPLNLTAGDTYQVMGNSGVVDPYTFNPTGFSTAPNITFDQDEYTPGNTLAFGTTTDGATAYFGPNFLESSAAATPEPGTLGLFATGLLGTVGMVRRKLCA
jgi:uncharacterized protein DUF4082/PEP-CTERM motif-containing protein